MDVDLGPAIHFVHGGMVGTAKEISIVRITVRTP